MDQSTPTKDIQAALTEAGLATYGTKEQMLDRLNKHAAAQLTDGPVTEEPTELQGTGTTESMPTEEVQVVQAPAGVKTNPNSPTIILSATAQQMQIIAPTNPITNRELENTLNDLKSAFPGLIVRYHPNEEIIQFEGGAQGRVTTTARQPAMAIKAAAREYVNIAGNAKYHKGDMGEVNPGL